MRALRNLAIALALALAVALGVGCTTEDIELCPDCPGSGSFPPTRDGGGFVDSGEMFRPDGDQDHTVLMPDGGDAGLPNDDGAPADSSPAPLMGDGGQPD